LFIYTTCSHENRFVGQCSTKDFISWVPSCFSIKCYLLCNGNIYILSYFLKLLISFWCGCPITYTIMKVFNSIF
jgi:hypothetical protein